MSTPHVTASAEDILTLENVEAAQRIMERCDELGAISDMTNGVSRLYLTPEHARCNETVAAWMQQAGMETWQDQAANQWGRLRCSDDSAPTLIIGSHLDTIPNAGKYDGILGVMTGIEVIEQLKRNGTELPFNIDLVGFGDEEGSRFGTTLLGSRAVAGSWNPEWFELTDKDGISIAQALRNFGCDPDRMYTASRAADHLAGYLEVHIEQGPILEEHNLPIGVVTSIAGAKRFLVKINGKAGHAGTVPMAMRQDALVAAATAVHLTEQIANRYQIVATVGHLQCYPGAANVIPGECQFTIDIRAGRDQARDIAINDMQASINEMITARNMKIEWEEIHSAPAVQCAGWMQRLWEEVILDMGLEPISMVSGAGHDAMCIAPITDMVMLFVRCAGGVSHNPAESVEYLDVAYGVDSLRRMIEKLAVQPTPQNFGNSRA